MNPHLRCSIPTILVAAALAVSGCSANAADAPGGSGSAAGLTIDALDQGHVAGTYSHDGVIVAFDLASSGGRHVAMLRSGDGTLLLSSTLEDDIETVSVLGGRLVISGTPRSPDPTIEGDRDAARELQQAPEMAIVPAMRDALAATSVPPDLYAPGLTSRALSTDSYYNASDGYWHLGPGESKTFPTWGFWLPTYLRLRDFGSPCATVSLYVGWSIDTVVVPANGYVGLTGYWWGVQLTVQNLNARVDWGGEVCGPTQIGAITQ